MSKSSYLKIWTLMFLLCLVHQISALQTPKPSTPAFNNKTPSPLQVASIYFVAPAIPAFALPVLTETFRATQDPSALLAVLVAKRGFIYVLAILSTAYAGWRASTSIPAGESLDALNNEILKGEAPLTESKAKDVEQKEQKEEKEEAVFAVLDEIEGVGQNVAFALPFVLATALSISYFLLQGSNQSIIEKGADSFDALAVFSTFSTVSNLAICLLFSAAEYRSCINTDSNDSAVLDFPRNLISLPNVLALVALVAASVLPLSQAWPFQNSINIALAVTVTRALAPFLIGESGSIRTVALALTGLAAYDLVSVFGTGLLAVQAAGAFDASSATSQLSDMAASATGITSESFGIDASSIVMAGDTSVMETVAREKLQGPWRPGLLEMVLVGRVSDVIGLGDIVFPACLVSWGFAVDMIYANAAIGGYVLGSLLTEIVSTIGPNQGLPALVFIAPTMLACVSLVAIQRGEMDKIWGEGDANEDTV